MNGTTLTSKLGVWKSYEDWKPTTNGTIIENVSKSKILGTLDLNIVGIQSRFDASEKSWQLGEMGTDGYFTITHLTSQKLLVPDENDAFEMDDFENLQLGLIYQGKLNLIINIQKMSSSYLIITILFLFCPFFDLNH